MSRLTKEYVRSMYRHWKELFAAGGGVIGGGGVIALMKLQEHLHFPWWAGALIASYLLNIVQVLVWRDIAKERDDLWKRFRKATDTAEGFLSE